MSQLGYIMRIFFLTVQLIMVNSKDERRELINPSL